MPTPKTNYEYSAKVKDVSAVEYLQDFMIQNGFDEPLPAKPVKTKENTKSKEDVKKEPNKINTSIQSLDEELARLLCIKEDLKRQLQHVDNLLTGIDYVRNFLASNGKEKDFTPQIYLKESDYAD